MTPESGEPGVEEGAVVTTTFTTSPRATLAAYRTGHRAGYVFRAALTALLVFEGIVTFQLFPIVAGILLFVGFELLVRRQLRDQLRHDRVVLVTMTEKDYIERSEGRRAGHDWMSFSSVRPTGQYWVLRLNWALAMTLPLDALNGEQTKEFEALLRRKGLRQ